MPYTFLVAGLKDLPPQLRLDNHYARRCHASFYKNDDVIILITANDVINENVNFCVRHLPALLFQSNNLGLEY